MNPNLTFLLILLGVFPMTAALLVMLGRPLRPFGHLMRVTLFWSVVEWAGVAVWLWTVRPW